MKRLLVLGAGTAGTMAVNKLRPRLPRDEWSITVVDPSDTHYYQPGYLFVPFGIYRPDEIVKPTQALHPRRASTWSRPRSTRSLPEENKVLLVDGTELPYDYLIIATGTTPRPDETPGMADDLGGSVHEFYTFEGATRAGREAAHLGGRPAGRPHHRDADQVPGRPAGVHLPGRCLLHRAGHARQGRDHLRDPAGGRVHQAGRVASTSATCSTTRKHRPRGRLHDRAHRPRGQEAGLASTSARCPTTCWSPSRSTWAPTSSPAPASATT